MRNTAGNTRKISLAGTIKRYQSLLESVDGIVWEASADPVAYSFVSDSITHILGYTPREWTSTPDFWKERIYPADKEIAIDMLTRQTLMLRHHTFDYRMVKADGNIAWLRNMVSLVNENGQPAWLRGITIDITETKLLADLEKLEKDVLELNSKKDSDIEKVLHNYVLGIESLFPKMTCSVLKVTENRVYSWATPSLPQVYAAKINGMEIGPDTGSCGTAAYTKQRIIVSDIEHDEKWVNYRDYALPHNLRACWSYPIIDAQGAVIAVFGIYYNTIKVPTEDELAIIERSAAILKVIIENRLYARMMQEINIMVTQGQELANFGTWQWDMSRDKVSWSSVLYTIYGVDEGTYNATFDSYIALLHPDDRKHVEQTIQNAISQRGDAVFEERIVRPGGEIRYLRSWAKVLIDDAGKPAKMIGASLDVTQTKSAEAKMQEIAWTQSHVVRAPLARLMGLVYLLREYPQQEAERQSLLSEIMGSADELDAIIRSITYNTEL